MRLARQAVAFTLYLLLGDLNVKTHATQTSSLSPVDPRRPCSKEPCGSDVIVEGAHSNSEPGSAERAGFSEISLEQSATRAFLTLPVEATALLPATVNALQRTRTANYYRQPTNNTKSVVSAPAASFIRHGKNETIPKMLSDTSADMQGKVLTMPHNRGQTNSRLYSQAMSAAVPSNMNTVIGNMLDAVPAPHNSSSAEADGGQGFAANVSNTGASARRFLPLPSPKSLEVNGDIFGVILSPLNMLPVAVKVILMLAPFICCLAVFCSYGVATTTTRPSSIKKVKYLLPAIEETSEKVRGHVQKDPVVITSSTLVPKALQKFAIGMVEGVTVQEGRFTAAVSGYHEDLDATNAPEENVRASHWKKRSYLGWWKSQEDFFYWAETGAPAPDDKISLLEITNVVNYGRNPTDVIITHTDPRIRRSTEYFFVFGSGKDAKRWTDNLEILLMKLKALATIGNS